MRIMNVLVAAVGHESYVSLLCSKDSCPKAIVVYASEVPCLRKLVTFSEQSYSLRSMLLHPHF